MKHFRLNKKAFTLVELCIVMALVAIVALLMTSFMAVFQPRVAQNQVRHDFLDEVSLVRDEMQKWINANDADYVVLVVSSSGADNTKIAYRAEGANETTCYVNFDENGTLEFFQAAADEKSLELKTIKAITLEAYVSDKSNNGKLLKCTLIGCDVFDQTFTQDLIFALRTSTANFVNADAGS